MCLVMALGWKRKANQLYKDQWKLKDFNSGKKVPSNLCCFAT